MAEAKKCPQCGEDIPADAPEGLCPNCLLKVDLQAAESQPRSEPPAGESGLGQTTPYSGRFVPPQPEELAPHFPQLEILELLGQGGMGAVYKARQPGLDRLVALKILPREIGADPAFAERFTREARALAKLSHPNIVAVYDFGRTPDGLFYFLMEFVDGVNLRQAIRSGSMSPKDALAIVPQICDALQFAHDEGIVHRDIKPENVLLDKRGRVKIADFGLAKLLGHAPGDVSLTGTQQVMGTLRYMAPEQMEGTKAVDHRADIYSLGVVFYELLTGEVPVGRFAPPSKKVQIDVRLDEVVLRALEEKPEQRYQHASELKTAVEQVAVKPAAAQPPVARETNQAVRSLLWWPAYAMLVFGPIVVFLGVSDIFRWWIEWTQHQTGIAFFPQEHLVAVVGGILAIFGGVAMLKLRWYGLAVAGVVGMLTGAGVGQTPDSVWQIDSLVIAIAVTGIACWAGIMLFLPAVREAFNEQREQERQVSAGVPVQSLDAILRQVKGPAMGLLATAMVNWIVVLLLICFGSYLSANVAAHRVPVELAIVAAMGWLITLTTLIMVGALKMKLLESYGWAIAASILAILGGAIGLPFGIWALVVLSRPEVKAAFGAAAPPAVGAVKPGTNPVKVLVVTLVIGLLAFALWEVAQRLGLHMATTQKAQLAAVTTLKSFSTTDPTISKDLVVEDGGWSANCAESRTISLFEVTNPGVEDCTITYRAQLKSETLKGRAYLEMWCRLPGSGEFFSRGLDHVATGSTDWASYETPAFLKKGEKPDLLRFNLVVEGAGRVGIRSVEVLTNAKQLPAASATSAKPVEKQAIAAAEVLRKMGDKYAAVSSFTASGQVVSEVTPAGGGAATTVKHTFAINLAWPEFYRITWTNPIAPEVTMRGAAWSAGDGHKTMIAGKVGTHLNREMALGAATGVSGGVALTVPSMFFKDDPNNLLKSLKNPKLLPEEAVGAEACYVVTADWVGRKATLWITKKDGFLKKIQAKTGAGLRQEMPPAGGDISDESLRKILKSMGQDSSSEAVNRLRKQAAEGLKAAGSTLMTSTTTYETIAVNEVMTKEDFEYSAADSPLRNK